MAGERTAERVHSAALRLFATRGFEGTGIREIAAAAGITAASLYHYVGTKEDLLEQMMLESMAALLAPATELAGTVSDPAQLVAGLVTLHVRRHAEHDQLCRVGDTELRSLSAARRGRVIELRDAYQEIWEEAIARGVHAGQFAVPDVKLAALALLQMCTGVAHWYSPSGRLTIGQVSGAFADMAAALLGSPAGAQHAVSRPAGAAAAAGGHG